MTVQLLCNNQYSHYNLWKFPGGEIGIKLYEEYPEGSQFELIVEGLHNSEDTFVLLNLLNALSLQGVARSRVTVTFKYFPYARQDRACNEGESFALEVFTRTLVAFNYLYGKIRVYDPHSNTTINLLNSGGSGIIRSIVEVIPQHKLTGGLPEYDWIIAPDKGAMEKARNIQPNTNHIYLNKTRVERKVIYTDLTKNAICGKVCVVDDIGDGMGTFISLAEMLQRTQPLVTQLDLYVTHGIFSRGLDILKPYYNKVYTFNLLNPEMKNHELLEITQQIS